MESITSQVISRVLSTTAALSSALAAKKLKNSEGTYLPPLPNALMLLKESLIVRHTVFAIHPTRRPSALAGSMKVDCIVN